MNAISATSENARYILIPDEFYFVRLPIPNVLTLCVWNLITEIQFLHEYEYNPFIIFKYMMPKHIVLSISNHSVLCFWMPRDKPGSKERDPKRHLYVEWIITYCLAVFVYKTTTKPFKDRKSIFNVTEKVNNCNPSFQIFHLRNTLSATFWAEKTEFILQNKS